MTNVVLFHSVLGLRPAELAAADRLRAAGHEVTTPDLYGGETATTLEDGFALKDRIGWSTVATRALDAARKLPEDTVLAGMSMGAVVAAGLLPHRPDTVGVLLLHAIADLPAKVREGLPIQLHAADPDDFAPPAALPGWLAAAARSGADARVFTYPGAGHFYTDSSLPDHDEDAAALTWQRILAFLAAQPSG
ncbi:dienelactone hydrolase family protein [Amycolatopsis roodepoortensis]|uniref:dienelactone hydrolase family protein n=1 Tax=Amycolatopsis roodepoortensis TaxID=700274 RepID=UPI00214A9366|nr:dienelactone hydrolase family protein [Amycolatopsis roodepoortensis]UUV30983.1 dienelactone hydrolase family protein [Amycolatopsis roodepoortensis]